MFLNFGFVMFFVMFAMMFFVVFFNLRLRRGHFSTNSWLNRFGRGFRGKSNPGECNSRKGGNNS